MPKDKSKAVTKASIKPYSVPGKPVSMENLPTMSQLRQAPNHQPNERISKTNAMKRFHLNESDLESVPRTQEESRASGSSAAPTTTANTTVFAAVNGPEIMRSQAWREFGLKASHLNTLLPAREKPNRHKDVKGPTRYYNLCDVKASMARVGPAGRFNSDDYDSDDDRNVFNGLSAKDAAYKFAQLLRCNSKRIDTAGHLSERIHYYVWT
ncbi:hypothetical protein C8R43DRAFT_1141672 [Mycena crocata]|nr:hypothetical protein C8R43DRAFT_1141672 [Mycena crocata]